jgi:hypothetical protein
VTEVLAIAVRQGNYFGANRDELAVRLLLACPARGTASAIW